MYQEYCTGCGLCKSVRNVSFLRNEAGFDVPQLTKQDEQFCKKVCPASGVQFQNREKESIWGNVMQAYLGWSLDPDVREKASSGGILTEIASYLLESNAVDGVIQTGESECCAWMTETVISTTRKEVIACCGSRYASSMPLANLIGQIEAEKKYAFIGKPCDVGALKNYMRICRNLERAIPITLSFFCAGVPGENAEKTLLRKMGCEPQECIRLNYRGNGWPGFCTAYDASGKEYKMTYAESWGKTLGRDIRLACRFCFDGIGLDADISCCDAWYQTSDGKPDLSEHEGRNAIFARTEYGRTILETLKEQNCLFLEIYDAFEQELPRIQMYQHDRRATMLAKCVAMKIAGRSTPKYPLGYILQYFKHVKQWRQVQILGGTFKRVMKKKM